MKKLYVILFSLFYGPISCTQPITYYWVTADDTTKIWISDKDFNPQTAEFHWDGPTFENLAHGTGTLHINTDHGKMAQHLNAFYGATDQKGIMKDLKKGNQYIGPKQNGKPHGFGVLVQPNNDLDIGHFQEGRLNGNVTFIRQGKPYYRGQYANDAFNGIGIRYDNDGEKNCIWKDGVAQACRGTKHLGKDKYTGYYTLNGCEGRGKMEYANGDVYEGEWKANKRNGQGRMDFADGRVYEGEWADGFAHGEGTYETNTFIYSGMWEKSAPDGFGFMKYIDGAKYNGTWKKGKKTVTVISFSPMVMPISVIGKTTKNKATGDISLPTVRTMWVKWQTTSPMVSANLTPPIFITSATWKADNRPAKAPLILPTATCTLAICWTGKKKG